MRVGRPLLKIVRGCVQPYRPPGDGERRL